MGERDFDDGPEVFVVPLAAPVTGINPVFGESPRTVGIFGEQQVAGGVEVSNDGHDDTQPIELLYNRRYRRRGGLVVRSPL